MVAVRAQASRPVAAAKAVIRVPAPLAKFAKVAGASAAAFSLTLAANAAVVKLGADDGSLVFVPSELTVKSGETVQFINNAGFPHNIVFDEDNVPAGVNAEALSNEDYMNAPGETVTRKFDTPGTYGYYCEPHQGAGMTGTITVQ